MISFYMIVLILTAHWIADFICQTDAQAKGKSSNWWILADHINTYTLVLGICLFWPAAVSEAASGTFWFPVWLVLNGALHFVTDAITSRITSRLWKEGKVHQFFCVIGFDQLIHTTCLTGKWYWLME